MVASKYFILQYGTLNNETIGVVVIEASSTKQKAQFFLKALSMGGITDDIHEEMIPRDIVVERVKSINIGIDIAGKIYKEEDISLELLDSKLETDSGLNKLHNLFRDHFYKNPAAI